MKICLVHGYLLTGTGSNVYVTNLARKLCSMGHDVIIMCQEPHPENIEFVSEFFEFDETNSRYEKKYEAETPFLGTCRVFRPELRKKLLVYVIDKYEGFDKIQTFQDSSLEEIETYIKQNKTALKTIIKDYALDAIQANHSIMQPYISYLATANTDIPYFATLHGSALNFSVKKSRRLHEYAMKGLNHASRVIAVSEYNAREFHDYLASMSEVLKAELKVIPAGVDIELFTPLVNGREIFLLPLKEKIKEKKKILAEGEKLIDKRELERKVRVLSPSLELKKLFSEIAQKYNQRHPDQDVIDTLNSIDWVNDKIVLFIGKYLWTKGIQVVITAIPLILKEVPKARFLFVGFGDSKEILQSLVFTLGTGNHALYEFMLKAHAEIDSGSVALTPPVCAMFLERLKDKGEYDKFFEETRRLSIIERCHFTGIMSHEELKYLLPIADVFVAPSIFTEAFGMVAIEAMASGVFPLISYQYGFKEINDAIIPSFEETLTRMPKLYLNSHLVPNLAKNIITVLKLGAKARKKVREKCRRLVEKNYSWDSISKKYVETFNR